MLHEDGYNAFKFRIEFTIWYSDKFSSTSAVFFIYNFQYLHLFLKNHLLAQMKKTKS